MTNIINVTYFIGERDIPNTDSQAVMEKLNGFISKYEPKLLTSILGKALYNALLAESPIVPDSILDKLLNGIEYFDSRGNTLYWEGLRSMIVDYVYFKYMASEVSTNTGKGVIIPKAEAAYNLSSSTKMIDAWNSLSKSVRSLYGYFYANRIDYPNYDLGTMYRSIEDFSPINEFDI